MNYVNEELLAELLSLRAEVERLRATVEEREKLLDRFTANNIKLNQELEKLRTTLTVLSGFTFVLPRPGCGNGGRLWREVAPIVKDLPDNVFVISK